MPFVTIKNQQMFYEEQGEGFPLLFGHSYLWDAAMWTPQVTALATQYRCIVPELWGHGRSAPVPAVPYSVEDLAEDYWTLAQALELHRFAIVGLSVGGMWAAHLALRHPEAIAALVLMDTYIGPEPEASHARFFQMLAAVEKAGCIPPPIIAATVPFFFSPVTSETAPEQITRFKDHLAAIPPAQIPSIVALGRGIFGRNSIIEQLATLTMPTLVVVGADDRSRPPHEARDMAARIPNARYAEIAQAGHICVQEQPEQVNTVLLEFLNSVLP